MSFTNLIRFKDKDGRVLYGDVPEAHLNNIIGTNIPILAGDPFDDSLKPTNDSAVVDELLPPVFEVPIFLCIGLNYAEHAREASLDVPPNPVLFIKPSGKSLCLTMKVISMLTRGRYGLIDSLAGPHDDIEIPEHAEMLDYEGELCFIVKQDAKNISPAEASQYILGYTAGNDISSRLWQRPPRGGGQYCYAKGFDKFAPLGPTIRNVTTIDVRELTLRTTVNGEQRQYTSASDMIFHPHEILAHLSRGCTVRKGTVVMTGTPSGIAGRMAGTPWLKNGDIVEVTIGRIGTIANKMLVA